MSTPQDYIKSGDRVTMSQDGKIFTKKVVYVEGNFSDDPEQDNWYLNFADGTNLRQQRDEVVIIMVEPALV